MRLRDAIITVVSLIAAIALLTAASTRLGPIQQARAEMGLVVNKPLENAPPSLAFATVAMGAFRGLVVEILWMRADRLKEEGLFFDARQLAEWITILQPRFAAVWDFHAWNMAYNISVAVPAEQWQERWKWVRNGYELIRDKGIPMNPRSIILYRSLAWIFQHKMGHVNDDCHRHYKRELALAMRPLLGESPTNQDFEALIGAPGELSEVVADAAVAQFVADLKAADKMFDVGVADLVTRYIELRQDPAKSASAFAVIDRYRGAAALAKFDLFARAYTLKNVWKLDPAFMHEMNNLYGRTQIDDPNEHLPLNWEHPDSHAIYWACLGLKVASKPGTYSIDEKNTDRIVFHGLAELYRHGNLILYPVPGQLPTVFLRPDLQMFDSCDKAWRQRIAKYELLEKGNPKAVRGGHRNFLENAIHDFYRAGHRRKAAEIYAELRRDYSEGEHSGDYSMPLVTFVRARIIEELDRISDRDATEMIIMSFREAYFRYAVHQDDIALGHEAWAKEVYELYQKKYGSVEQYRVGLPTLELMRYLAFRDFMADEFYPDYLKRNLWARIKVERPDLFEKLQAEEAEYIRKQQEQAAEDQQGASQPTPSAGG